MTQEAEFRHHLKEATCGFMTLGDEMIAALWTHYEMMLKWNRKVNLTRVVSLPEAVEVHYAESLFLASRIPNWVCSVLDVGSGAGFPGFPIATAKPNVTVTLVESDTRKAAFLREVSDIVENLRVETHRVENLAGEWDCLTSRAVRLSDLERIAVRGKSVMLLVGKAGVEEVSTWRGLEGVKSEKLPWGHNRFLVKATVPRGT